MIFVVQIILRRITGVVYGVYVVKSGVYLTIPYQDRPTALQDRNTTKVAVASSP